MVLPTNCRYKILNINTSRLFKQKFDYFPLENFCNKDESKIKKRFDEG